MGLDKLFGGAPEPEEPDNSAVEEEESRIRREEANRRRALLSRAKGQGGRQTGTLGNPDIVRQGLASRLGGTQ